MGKGLAFLNLKYWHPNNNRNQEKKYLAEQKHAQRKQKEADRLYELQAEKEMARTRAVLNEYAPTREREFLSRKRQVEWMYSVPPGLQKTIEDERRKIVEEEKQQELNKAIHKMSREERRLAEREMEEGLSVHERNVRRFPELKNAPLAAPWVKNVEVHHKPVGKSLRQVKCFKCHKWGHSLGDRECEFTQHPLKANMFNASKQEIDDDGDYEWTDARDEQPENSSSPHIHIDSTETNESQPPENVPSRKLLMEMSEEQEAIHEAEERQRKRIAEAEQRRKDEEERMAARESELAQHQLDRIAREDPISAAGRAAHYSGGVGDSDDDEAEFGIRRNARKVYEDFNPVNHELLRDPDDSETEMDAYLNSLGDEERAALIKRFKKERKQRKKEKKAKRKAKKDKKKNKKKKSKSDKYDDEDERDSRRDRTERRKVPRSRSRSYSRSRSRSRTRHKRHRHDDRRDGRRRERSRDFRRR